MHTETIYRIEELFPLLTPRSFCLFRGLSNAKYHLTTSLARNGGNERAILRNFAKYAALEDTSIWKQMVIGQHHGLPTRLLDWSHSPLVALYFAISEKNPEDIHAHDCILWQIDVDEVNSLLPRKYMTMLKEDGEDTKFFTLRKLNSKNVEMRDIDDNQAVLLLEPPAIDMRIINQFSFFSVIPNTVEMEVFLTHTDRTVEYIIDKSIRSEIQDMLDGLNISERTMLTDLDGMCTQLSRFYRTHWSRRSFYSDKDSKV